MREDSVWGGCADAEIEEGAGYVKLKVFEDAGDESEPLG